MSEVSKILPQKILNDLRQLETLIFKKVDPPQKKRDKLATTLIPKFKKPFFCERNERGGYMPRMNPPKRHHNV